MSRRKGVASEREAAALIREHTGWDAQRRVRQHDGDSDILGVPWWAIEIKRHRAAGPAEIARWWQQAMAQRGEDWPMLMYRLDRQDWRCVWPLAALHMSSPQAGLWSGWEWTCTTGVEGWAAVAREVALGAAPIGETF